MILTPPAHSRPSLLIARLIIGGALMAALILLAHGGTFGNVALLLLGLPLPLSPPPSTTPLWIAALRTTVLLCTAGAAGLSTAYLVTTVAIRFGRSGIHLGATLGRLVAATPVVALVWAWIGWWMGTAGGTIETLMPPRSDWEDGLASTLARLIWHDAAPMLWLALVASGLLTHAFCTTLAHSHFEDLLLGLKGRGLKTSHIRHQHLPPLLWPLLHRRLQGIGAALLALSVPVESALHYPGWGTAFAQALHQQSPAAIASAVFASSWILASWIALCTLVRPRDPRAIPLWDDGLARPALLDAQRTAALDSTHLRRHRIVRVWSATFNVGIAILTILALLRWLQSVHPITAPGIQTALTADLNTLGKMALGVLGGGAILTALRHTILGESLRRLGWLESIAWSPLIVWVLAWHHSPGSVVNAPLTLTLVGAVILAVELHACTRRAIRRDYLTAAKVLGATPWHAWSTHALRPWVQDLVGTFAWLIAALWSALILTEALTPPDQANPHASLGQWLAEASGNALITQQPQITAAGITLLSTLFLWTLSRIILPSDDF